MDDRTRAAEVAQVAVGSLHASARRHKRLSAQHRRAARQDMEAARQLTERCRRVGIEIIIEPLPKPEA